MEKLTIYNITNTPIDQALETPLQPNQMRVVRPSDLDPEPPPTASTSSESQPHDEMEYMYKGESLSLVTEDLPPLTPGSPEEIYIVKIEEFDDSPIEHEQDQKRRRTSSPLLQYGSATSSSPTMVQRIPHQPLSDEFFSQLSYGSEPDSDESDNEDVITSTTVPRVVRILMETPQDEDSPTPDQGIVSDDSVVIPTIDMQPTYKPFKFQWTPVTPTPPHLRREQFSNYNLGPTSPHVDPYDTFIAIWDLQFMEHIASETNRYAEVLVLEKLHSHTLQPNSRICEWRDTTVDELYVYFAILLAMGVVVKSKIEEYWGSSTDIFLTPGFRAQMSQRRFQLLTRCLHFNNNEELCTLDLKAYEARLFKIQPVISHLNSKFQSLYKMRRNITLDESLLQWKSGLDINQLIPNRPASVGIKTYELCESQTGYLWRFEVHAQKEDPLPQQGDPLSEPTAKIVLRLIQGLENKGHTLWLDNFYNSPSLARKLKSLGFDCVGTLRTNRRFVPEALHNLTKANMHPGEITGFTSGDVDVMVWSDYNRVAMISTYHGNTFTVTNGVRKPVLIDDFNTMMVGVDKKDQTLAMYPIERKKVRVWYKKLFHRLLNVSVFNSFILLKNSFTSSMSYRSFRILLIKSLLEKHSSRTYVAPPTLHDRVFEVKHHHLAEYPFLPGKSGRQRRICTVCKKRIQSYCVGCNKAVCMIPCFITLHP